MAFIWIASEFGEPKKHYVSGTTEEQVPWPKLMEAVLPYQTSVYVTVLNIIQCIALAFWINEVRDLVMKNELTSVGTLRFLVSLTIIFVVWHRYISELQYLWPISWGDTLLPFVLGIIECGIVFLHNPNTVSLSIFMLSFMVFELWTAFAYRHGYRKRVLKTTGRLYENVYSAYPQYATHLMRFLKDFYLWHFKVFLFASAISGIYLIFVTIFPGYWNEFIFPIILLAQMIQGEVVNNFQKALRKDKQLGLYFQERRMS